MIIVKGITRVQLRADVHGLDFAGVIIFDRFNPYINYKKEGLKGWKKWNLTQGN